MTSAYDIIHNEANNTTTHCFRYLDGNEEDLDLYQERVEMTIHPTHVHVSITESHDSFRSSCNGDITVRGSKIYVNGDAYGRLFDPNNDCFNLQLEYYAHLLPLVMPSWTAHVNHFLNTVLSR
jgi:hypothetical protein